MLGVANGKLLVSAGKMGYIQTELFKTSNDYQSAKDTSTIWVEQIFRDIYEKREIQSTLGFATMGKAANLGLATSNAMTDLF